MCYIVYSIESNQQLSSNGTSTLDASFLTFRLNSFISHGNVWMNAVRILFIFQSSFSVLINTICHFFVPTLEIFKLAKKTKLPNKNCQSVVFWEKKCQFFFFHQYAIETQQCQWLRPFFFKHLMIFVDCWVHVFVKQSRTFCSPVESIPPFWWSNLSD